MTSPEHAELILAHFPSPEMPRRASALLDALDAMADEADRLTGAWRIRAEVTPRAFIRRAARLRKDAARAIEALPLPEVVALLTHPLFSQPSRALRIGPSAVDPAVLPPLHAALLAQPGPDLPRQLLLNMLLGPGWRAPLPPADLDEALLGPWLGWAAAPALLHGAGEDDAWAMHAARLLNWIADQLPDAQGSRREMLVRAAMQLDLGPLLLAEVDHAPAHTARARVLALIAPSTPGASSQARAGPPRIGLICRSLERGPDAEALLAHVTALPPGRLHIEAFSLEFRDRVARPDPAFTARLDAVLAARHALPGDPWAIRAMIAGADLDLLLLASATSWGITPLDLALFHPLARTGAVVNSHVPLPLGYPGLPGFITGPSTAPMRAMAQPWVEMPGPILPPQTATPASILQLDRAAFGLPADKLILMSGAPAQKLRQPCLAAMIEALCALPEAILVLAPHNPGWAARSLGFAFNAQVAAEADRAGVGLARIHIMGELTRVEAEALLAEADIYLNPFPHGGATMTRLALALGVPPVTMARRSTRSIDPFILQDMGLDELIAPSPEAWMARIIRLGRDPKMRADLRARILRAHPHTSPDEHARHFEAALTQAISQASTPPPPADAPVDYDDTAPCHAGG